MNAADWTESLSSLPEIQILLESAHRLGIRFGLRGGVLRNVLLSERNGSAGYDTLYDFVDPFGDIDIVVLSEVDQESLVRVLFQALPFADFHSWHFQMAHSAEEAATRRATVAADRLVLWFDGQEGNELSFGAFGADVQEILNNPTTRAKSFSFRPESDNPMAQLLGIIKYARISLQSPEQLKSVHAELGHYVDLLREEFATWSPRRRQSPWRGRVSRLEIALAQLILNAADWSQASSFLHRVGESVSGEWLRNSEALGMMFRGDLESHARLGMVLYRPRQSASFRFDVNRAVSYEDQPGSSLHSRIPWTRLTLRNMQGATRCDYSDFEEGIGVIAWRDSEPEATHRDENMQVDEYGVVARPAAPGRDNSEFFSDEELIPISGYIRRGRSIVIRIDPAYLKLITGGRSSTFLIGLLPISSSENVQEVERLEPRSPEGRDSEDAPPTKAVSA